jgi:hypothetical protein
MASKGYRKRLNNDLTPKQNAFVKKIIKQLVETGDINGTQAALEVYDTTDPRVAGDIASDNLKKPEIKKELEQIFNDQGISSDKIASNLGKIANQPAYFASADTILKANLEILKIMGHYPGAGMKKGSFKKTERVETLGYDAARQTFTKTTQEVETFMTDVDSP